ncbi:MAG TPA: FtsH protease activity modulator HflK [Stenotrophobium sp.]|jgi:membrane protease subunit HflK|nr:FtsH protease activity modulator HflK [Stenotrophobium sp.]
MAWNEPGPGRDPWNQGPKKGTGSPDLEEMLKRLKARLGGSGGKTPGSQISGGVWGLLIALLAVLWIASGFYVVDEQERGVVLRFGRYVATTQPGLRWHLPWPVEDDEVVNVTGVRSIKDEAVMLTKDENIVDVDLSVQYRVSSAEDYLFNVDDPDATLRQATKSAVREVVGQSDMDYILTDGREEVGNRTKQLLQDRLDAYKTGLVVTEVNMQQAQPPEPVQAAFADAIKAREDQQRLKSEAEAYANDRLPKARGAAARQMAEAVGYRAKVIARAQGDASRFLQLDAEYRKAPRVTRERLYLDSIGSVLSNSSKVLVDVDKGSPMIYLPLDQIMKNQPKMPALATPPDTAASGSTSGGSNSGATSPGSSDSGDALRSRERGRP